MTKIKLYLDTSIPSALFGYSKAVRQLITQKWFEHESSNYVLFTSVIAIEEIDNFTNQNKREMIKDVIVDNNVQILTLTQKAKRLANEYISKGAIPPKELEDAYHIAIATVSNIDCLASWNFKHIVSINPIKKIHEINKKNGYNIIEIGSLELFGGAKYGSL